MQRHGNLVMVMVVLLFAMFSTILSKTLVRLLPTEGEIKQSEVIMVPAVLSGDTVALNDGRVPYWRPRFDPRYSGPTGDHDPDWRRRGYR